MMTDIVASLSVPREPDYQADDARDEHASYNCPAHRGLAPQVAQVKSGQVVHDYCPPSLLALSRADEENRTPVQLGGLMLCH